MCIAIMYNFNLLHNIFNHYEFFIPAGLYIFKIYLKTLKFQSKTNTLENDLIQQMTKFLKDYFEMIKIALNYDDGNKLFLFVRIDKLKSKYQLLQNDLFIGLE